MSPDRSRTRHTADLPFRLRDRDGAVHVEVRPNDDPEELGHPLVAIGYDVSAFRGFPVVEATISYDGYGPRAWMGWLQVIERHDDDGGVVADVDVADLFGGASPLYTFGYLPTFSDFPANPDHPDGDWVAHAFLVAVPDVVRTRRLAPVVGFRWGYRLVSHRPVELFEPTRLAPDSWRGHRALLESDFTDWTFLPWIGPEAPADR
jgi:hypothetical protein